jgi:hypothetical protein
MVLRGMEGLCSAAKVHVRRSEARAGGDTERKYKKNSVKCLRMTALRRVLIDHQAAIVAET